MSGTLVPGDATAQGRIVSYVVSGVGFLGAGVIFKENAQIRVQPLRFGARHNAAIVMGGVLLANTALRPLAYRLHPLGAEHKPDEVCYHVELTCKSQEESRVRSLLLIPCGAKIK